MIYIFTFGIDCNASWTGIAVPAQNQFKIKVSIRNNNFLFFPP